MTILVTGSAGHLGEALMRLLREQNQPAIGLDVLDSPFTNVVGSITDAALCQQVVAEHSIQHILHTASLHKPHVATHPRHAFVEVNITGTLNLLEAAVAHQVQSFVFTSTTSTFGEALQPTVPGAPAVWIDETVTPIPKNIYGVTKTAAEDLVWLFSKLHQLPSVVLKVSRFFPEDDDTAAVRAWGPAANTKLLELLVRRADLYDMATAHLLALHKAPQWAQQEGCYFDKFIISGSNPFVRADCASLAMHAPAVVHRYFPQAAAVLEQRGWKVLDTFDRVYCSAKAQQRLGWTPVYTFQRALEQLQENNESNGDNEDERTPFGSELARLVGKKMYHRQPQQSR